MKSLKSKVMHFVRRWHARFGVFAAVFFFLLVLSGIALNHTGLLGLAKKDVSNAWLMSWYGLRADYPSHGYLFNNGYFAASSERWVMDGLKLPNVDSAEVLGALDWHDMRVIATADALYLYTPDGQLVDRLTGDALPATPLKRLAVMATIQSSANTAASLLVVDTADGAYNSIDGFSWHKSVQQRHSIGWVTTQSLPVTFKESLMQAFAPSLSLERIVLDLHSGRVFGQYGPLAMDIIAIVLMLLSLSGIWIYLRSSRKRQHGHKS